MGMMSPQSAVMIVIGIIALIGGYSMFKSMLPLWGFILGGWLAFTFAPSFVSTAQASSGLFQAIAFIVGGLIGALLSVPLYFLIIFLSGAALGALAGVIIGAVIDVGGFQSFRQITSFMQMSFPPIPHSPTQYVIGAVAGIILGGAAINFQKFMLIASSSFLGSAAIVSGLFRPITQLSNSSSGQAASMMIAWIVLGIVGMLIQFRMSDDV